MLSKTTDTLLIESFPDHSFVATGGGLDFEKSESPSEPVFILC